MSNNQIANKPGYRFAFRSSLYITIFLTVTLYAAEYLLRQSLPWWFVLIQAPATFLCCFIIIQYRVEKFIYRRIKQIYEEVTILETSAFSDKQVTTDMKTLREQVERFARNKKMEIESLKVRENYRREFLGNISHELKTPLFTVQGYIDTLLDGAHKDKALRKKYLQRAQKGVDRLTYIVSDMDMITKLEVGDMALEMEEFDLVALLQHVFDQFEIKSGNKNITLVFDMDYDQPILVKADRERIMQVVSNLIMNSIKYGKENGTTEVAIEDLTLDKILIRVTDNGEGIAREYLERLFERFFRVDRTGSRKEGGSGLGLAIVKHILDAHDERIYVDSEPGIGSEFSFTLQKAASIALSSSDESAIEAEKPE